MQEREAIWHLIHEQVAHLDDGTGKKVDWGIRELVVALRAHGCPTFASCAGHLEWGDAQPWVDIKLPGAPPRCEEDEDSWAVVRPRERQMRLALVRLLDQFYREGREEPHHARLVVHRLGGPGWLHLSTVALDAGPELPFHERSTWHAQARNEADAFASFLKGKFLSNGPGVGEAPILS